MKNQFCTYEISKKLRDIGFDEECFAGYDHTKLLWYPAASRRNTTRDARTYKKISHQNSHIIKAPLWQQAIAWLEINHNISISIEAGWAGGKFIYEICIWFGSEDKAFAECFENRNESLRFAMEQVLKDL